MGIPEITQVLKRETEAWNAHDADRVAACYAEDAVLYDVGLPEPAAGARGNPRLGGGLSRRLLGFSRRA